MRKLLLFGNGIGRALDPVYFDLGRALRTAWDDPVVLNDEQKQLIWQCLPADVIEENEFVAPQSEDQLGQLQRVLAACDEIQKCEIRGGADWLNSNGKAFPFAIRSFIHRAASYFHEGDHILPATFISPLRSFLLQTRSHVVTLNYDELLYRSFIGTELFNGFQCMLDGFVGAFSTDNLSRFRPSQQSYYLHLHGSPLYYSSVHGTLHKSGLKALPELHGYSSTHLVLTDVKYKRSVIGASEILRTYWEVLERAMSESQGVILVGYGGDDTHLNELIRKHFTDKQIEVVERAHDKYSIEPTRSQRFDFWRLRLGKAPSIFWHENILNHQNWNYVKPLE